ncbi:LptA/OstA family protein [Erythrobacter sp. THAF29]|uniref:LptA/OstA family protein n=1 Tax=Erythrobacter sp. THAF29 TaxID=2587851 RepID=UPI001268EE10|nr:LptA/OstA family protein [Erythrobacter sp. THAF29]QFT76536.1 LPS-assembly protein LptD [Erythrobacter sp. THAF29]
MTAKRNPAASLRRTAFAWGAGSFAFTLAVAGGIGLQAQGIASHNTRAPVTYDAGSIELQDRQNRVALSGGVTVTQAGLTVRSQRMLVNFTDTGSLDIQRITATGGVTVTRGNERASGDVAIYDFNRRVITMAGNVRLRRGTDTLNGGRLTIDLRSGISSVDGRASGGANPGGSNSGRVTGTFSVPQDNDDDQ